VSAQNAATKQRGATQIKAIGLKKCCKHKEEVQRKGTREPAEEEHATRCPSPQNSRSGAFACSTLMGVPLSVQPGVKMGAASVSQSNPKPCHSVSQLRIIGFWGVGFGLRQTQVQEDNLKAKPLPSAHTTTPVLYTNNPIWPSLITSSRAALSFNHCSGSG